jgi:hypothetical protein
MTKEQYDKLQKGDELHFARVMAKLGYYEIHDVVVVSKSDDHCTVSEKKTKQAFLFSTSNALNQLYIERKDALEYLKEEKKNNKDVKTYSLTKEESTGSEE